MMKHYNLISFLVIFFTTCVTLLWLGSNYIQKRQEEVALGQSVTHIQEKIITWHHIEKEWKNNRKSEALRLMKNYNFGDPDIGLKLVNLLLKDCFAGNNKTESSCLEAKFYLNLLHKQFPDHRKIRNKVLEFELWHNSTGQDSVMEVK